MRGAIYRVRQRMRWMVLVVCVLYGILAVIDAEAARTAGIGYIIFLLTTWGVIRVGRDDGG